MDTQHGDARYWTTFVENCKAECAGFHLHRERFGQGALVGQTIYWDATGRQPTSPRPHSCATGTLCARFGSPRSVRQKVSEPRLTQIAVFVAVRARDLEVAQANLRAGPADFVSVGIDESEAEPGGIVRVFTGFEGDQALIAVSRMA